jgi:hypothetical protein
LRKAAAVEPRTALATLTSPFEIDDNRIRLADAVLVYLERTLAASDPLPPGVVPRPYGLALLAVSSEGGIVAPVAPGEAVWLGFQAVDPTSPAIVRVRVDTTPPVDALSGAVWDAALEESLGNHLMCPPDYCLPGVRGPAGYVPFGQRDETWSGEVVEELTLMAYGDTQAEVTVRLVSPDAFTRETGTVPEPIDPDRAYKGWRLP